MATSPPCPWTSSTLHRTTGCAKARRMGIRRQTADSAELELGEWGQEAEEGKEGAGGEGGGMARQVQVPNEDDAC